VGAVAAVATVESVLAHRKADEITDEIGFLHTTASDIMLHSIENYNARYGKYGVHINPNELPESEPRRTIEATTIARTITLKRLYPLRKRERDIGVISGISAAIAAFASATLLELGL
jgi:hypothetical protein